MLYDPKWESPAVKVTEPSPADFIAWLETKNPEGRYDFDDCNGLCLVGQYMAHHGKRWRDSTYRDYCEVVGGNGVWFSVPVAISEPHTFGAALERAREMHGPVGNTGE